ncbi:MAG: hypothetical protein ACRDOH_11925 [Streptosporangiaceae bacterium]
MTGPLLRELLHTVPLTGTGLLVVFLRSPFLGYAAVRPGRIVFRRRRAP